MVLWCDFSSGWISGMAGLLVGHPIDTIKVRLQLDSGGGSISEVVKYIRGTHNHQHGSSSFLSFYRGMGTPLITNGVLNSLFFGFYGGTIHYLNDGEGSKGEASYTQHFLAGCVGGFAQLTVSCPVDLVKVQLQSRMQKEVLKGPVDCVKQILKTQGILGLYKGLGVQLLRDVPSSGVYFLVYEFCKRNLSSSSSQSPSASADDKVAQFLSGGVAGTLSWLSILPLDVVKSRIQGDSPHSPKYHGMIHCFRIVLREQGIPGLFRGFWPVSIRAFPVNGVTFLVYEILFQKCREYHLTNTINNEKVNLIIY